MRYQPIYDIAEVCARKSVTEVVLCPGSRCAPLTLAFTRHPRIRTRIFSDERSAGFIALGMAQSSQKPVIIVCTSGTAVYNLAPAIAEAYFSHTPLIVMTADRPAEWIAQQDGQTIYQDEVYGKHVKKYFELPQDYDHSDSIWAVNRIVNEAVNLSMQKRCGPVHINAPFREPLYPVKGDNNIQFGKDVRIIQEHLPLLELTNETREAIKVQWPEFNKVLLVGGQQVYDERIVSAVRRFRDKHQTPVVHDIISNLHDVGDTVQHSDLLLGQASANHLETLRPDLLITFGDSLVSKNLKIFLRKFPAKRHWHIQPAGQLTDPFKTVTDVFLADPVNFLNVLAGLDKANTSESQKRNDYKELWDRAERRVSGVIRSHIEKGPLNEMSLVSRLLAALPDNSSLHLANSMSVRYANFIGLNAGKGVGVFSNRGTSGIDGSTSTAVGHALASPSPSILITGDLAFFYDRNAFWHNYPTENLRVLLLNNHGGLIFDVLDGPSSTPEAREYFITRQNLNSQSLCSEFNMKHLGLSSHARMDDLLEDFLHFDGVAKVLELEGDTTTNKMAFEKLKSEIRKSYEL